MTHSIIKIISKRKFTIVGCIFYLIVSVFLSIPVQVFAASTPTGELLKQIGSGAPTGSGDYVSSSGGLNTYYAYFIEVPPGTGRLVVRIFDADVGLGGANDWTSDFFNTSCTYRLYDPNGNTVSQDFITGSNTGPPGSDSNWRRLCRINNPMAGHWQLRVNMSSGVTGGNDMNGYGIRAVDIIYGTELNIYAESFIPLGQLGTPASQTTTLYPYITSGCTVDSNDWDGDNGGGTYCTLSITSRTGSLTTTFNGSGGSAWLNNPISGFTTDLLASDYGIWNSALSYSDLGSGANFGVFYMGNYNASNPPPTSQPETGTFRIYFRSNSGGAPVKPFLTHSLSHVSGPNPPSNGSTTRVKVAVTILNPTPFSITFSSGNLVRANVPGTGAVYAGNASVTQGSITGQPSIGGTGNITWNPGTVSGSNNYETLYYEVDVTPTSSGQRIPVTGTPASNGTTATFVDETGNTTQTRATLIFGPLCELAVTEGIRDIPTLAAIASFNAYDTDNGGVVQWETASEIDTAGFYLLRKDYSNDRYLPVNRSLLPGLLHCPRGGIYRYVDGNAFFGETYSYKIVEVESKGGKQTYGPFTVTVGAGEKEIEPMQGTYSKKPHPVSPERKARLRQRMLEVKAVREPGKSGGKNAAKIALKERGLYYVDAEVIADVSGMNANQVTQGIRNQNLVLSNRGQTAAYLPAEGDSGIYFYGENIDSIYTDKNIYRLEKGNGSSMLSVYGGLPVPLETNTFFFENLHLEEDHYSLTALFEDPGDDFWLWDFISAGQAGKTFTFQAHGAAASGTASLAILLKGATDTSANPDHHVTIKLNGTQIGESQWNGTKSHTFEMSFNQSLLVDGENTVEVAGILDSGVSYSIFYLDSFDLTYQRHYRAVNDRLVCRGEGNPVVTVEGFSDSNIMVFEVTDPVQPVLVTGTTIDLSSTYRVSFTPSSPESVYLALSPYGLQSPVSVTAAQSPSLKQKQNRADYVIIVPGELADAVQDLVILRERRGLETLVAEVEDIYDEFNHGISSPEAIKSFLSYAYGNWKKAPEYVVLVGDGTYDYKDNLGYGDNLVPPLLVNTSQGLFASDSHLGDVKGKDGVPEIAVGRLPVLTADELQTCIDKIAAYEEAGGEWTSRVMMLADDPDNGGDFPRDSDYLAGLVPGNSYTMDSVYLPDFPTVDEARNKVLAGFNAGALLVNFIGHAGLDRLAGEGLLKAGDISSLNNEEKLPVLTAMTCVVGRFAIPGYESLSEAIVLASNGGAVAVLAPTGASLNNQSIILAEAFFKAFFQGQEKTLGKLLLKAMKDFAALDGDPIILNMYNLLGDPALEMK